MSADEAMALLAALLRVTGMVAAPILLASLVAGVLVGIVQTATQINEASISFVLKAVAVAATLVVLGPTLAQHVLAYTRGSFEAIAHVVNR